MKKVLFSLMTLMVVTGLVGGGAFAYFSDTETSKANSFAAGTLDLTVDGTDDTKLVPVYFDSTDEGNLKPGDTNFVVIDLDNVGTLKGKASITFANVANSSVATPEPEVEFGVDNGDLGANILITVQYGTATVIDAKTLDSLKNVKTLLGELDAAGTQDVKVTWSLPSATGNVVQADKVTFDIVFSLDQYEAP